MRYRIGIDVGGTFIDLLLIDMETRSMVSHKVMMDRDTVDCIVDGLTFLAGKIGHTLNGMLKNTEFIFHGTTATTNVILTRKGAKTALITTEGFRDYIDMQKGVKRPEYIFDLKKGKEKPLIPRFLVFPVGERIDASGEILSDLRIEDLEKTRRRITDLKVESVAICLLNSYLNPVHEIAVEEFLREELPGLFIASSYRIYPEAGFYERINTSALNAYAGPAVVFYLKALAEKLERNDFNGKFLVVQADGSLSDPSNVMESPIRTIQSGPSCGPTAGIFIAQPMGIDDIITIDMGGTSFDVSLVRNGQPLMSYEAAVGGIYHIRLPRVDVHTVGAGGGSIAWIGRFGALHVGPESAGADPGPACYGKGSLKPTVTDADLILGYLNPDYFLGGEIRLDPDLAYRAVEENIAEPLGMDVAESARSIVAIADHNMTDAIATVSVRRGEDPRKYTLVVAGGAGPVHAARLAKELRIRKVLIPRFSSIFCALGSIISDIRHDFVASIVARMSELNMDKMREIRDSLRDSAIDLLEKEGIPTENRYFRYSWDMRYEGQYHEISVPIDESEMYEEYLPSIAERFHRKHEALFGYRDVTDIEVINFRLEGYGRVRRPDRKPLPGAETSADKHVKAQRDVFFFELNDFTETPVYDGDSLEPGNAIPGPAVVEQSATTIVVPPDSVLKVTGFGDYMIELGG